MFPICYKFLSTDLSITFLNLFKTLSSKFDTEEADIQSDIEFGNSLLRSYKIANKDSQEALRQDIDDYTRRKVQISSLLMEERTK